MLKSGGTNDKAESFVPSHPPEFSFHKFSNFFVTKNILKNLISLLRNEKSNLGEYSFCNNFQISSRIEVKLSHDVIQHRRLERNLDVINLRLVLENTGW